MRLFPGIGDSEQLWKKLVRVKFDGDAVNLSLNSKPVREVAKTEQVLLNSDGHYEVSVECEVRRWAGRSEIVRPNRRQNVTGVKVDPVLSRALGQAHQLITTIKNDPSKTFDDLGQGKGIHDSYIRRLTRLAFLAPDIQEAILEGRQPVGLNLQSLMHRDLPMMWDEQRKALGFTAA